MPPTRAPNKRGPGSNNSTKQKKAKESEYTPMDEDKLTETEDISDPDDPLNKQIPIKPHDNYYDLGLQLKRKHAISLAKSHMPYTTLFGESEDSFHDDLNKITVTLARYHFESKNRLSADQLKFIRNNHMTTKQWIHLVADFSLYKEDILLYMNVDEVTVANIIITRLSFSNPKTLLGANGRTTPAVIAAKIWYAANFTIGSWFSKPKDTRQASLKEAFASAAPNPDKDIETDEAPMDIDDGQTPQNPTHTKETPSRSTKKSVQINTDLNKVATVTPAKDMDNTHTKQLPQPTSPNQPAGSPNKANAPTNATATEENNPTGTPELKSSLKNQVQNPYVRDKADKEASKRRYCRRYTIKFKVPQDKKRQAKEHVHYFNSLLFTSMKQLDATSCFLPWHVGDLPKTYPITSRTHFPKSYADFRPYFAGGSRPNFDKDFWYRIHIGCDENPDNFTSTQGSKLFDFFDDHNTGAYYCTVHDSDNPVEIAYLLYQGSFCDHNHLTNLIRTAYSKVNDKLPPIRIGIRTKTVKDVVSVNEKSSNWVLRDNQLPVVEADIADAKKVKKFLYACFNGEGKTLGGYNTRTLPVFDQIITGSDGKNKYNRMLGKHVAIVNNLVLMRVTTISTLNELVNTGHGKECLRTVLGTITYPLCPPQDSTPQKLFHSMDFATSGSDARSGVVYFTAYKDRADLAERLLDILPAYLVFRMGHTFATKVLHEGKLQECPEVHRDSSDYSTWQGTWTTEEDAQLDAILDEDMGIEICIEGLDDVMEAEASQEGPRTFRTTDEMSFNSYKTALTGQRSKPSPQQAATASADDDDTALSAESTSGGQMSEGDSVV